ncbi:DUF421 domain-containing protein [Streptomyces sp. NPDC017230]|uniref:DUF421 domain-containing protein n=1 Tax=unclassified Streptomyces TaxID=2593676 RepID=UPI0037BB89FE
MSWLVGDGTTLWHTAIKAVLLFLVAVAGFRLGERRTLAELAAFDFAAVVSVGAVIGRTSTAADTSFLTGVVALTAILLTHRAVTRLRYRPRLARLIDQPVRLLVIDGRLQHRELRRCGLTDADVLAVLRTRGVDRLAGVRYLLYEAKGGFSVVGPDAPPEGEPLAVALHVATCQGEAPGPR